MASKSVDGIDLPAPPLKHLKKKKKTHTHTHTKQNKKEAFTII